MNLANASNTLALERLISETANVDTPAAKAVVRALHLAGYGVVHAPCDECRVVHESFPTVRAFHSPLCGARGKCAGCGAKIPELSCDHFTQIVGALCEACYLGGPPCQLERVNKD